MEIKQKEQEEGDEVALDLNIAYPVNVEKDVAVDVCETQQYAKDLKVVVVLDILVCDFSTPFAFLKTVVVILELSDYFGK